MGQQIIREPIDRWDDEPLYCVFSSIVDDVVVYNGTEEEIIEHFVSEAAERARQDALRTFEALRQGKVPYARPFALAGFESMLRRIESVHGPGAALKTKKMIETGEEQ